MAHRRSRQKHLINCRLFIDSHAVVETGDPDDTVPWEHVKMIDALTERRFTCPICLDEPIAARSSQCGHVYCLPCLKLYRQTSSKCAICGDYMADKEIKPARIQVYPSLKDSKTIRFSLVQVDQGVTQPAGSLEHGLPTLKSNGWWFSRFIKIDSVSLQRFLLADLKYIKSRIQDRDYDDEAEALGLFLAQDNLTDELESLGCSSSTMVDGSFHAKRSSIFAITQAEINTLPEREFTADSSKVYMYQASCGSPAFVNPLWTRTLITQFCGDANAWDHVNLLPKHIDVKVTRVETLTVDDYLQRRYKCLSHLPIGSLALLCDVELGDLISPETRKAFERSLDRREKDEKERQARDKLEDRRKEEYEAKAEKEHLKRFDVLREPQAIPKPEDFAPLPSTGKSSSPALDEESPRVTFAQIASRPSLPDGSSTANAALIDSFIQQQGTSRGKKKSKVVLRLAG